MNQATDSNYKLKRGKLLAEGEKKATLWIIYIYNTCTYSGTRQRPFDLWLILRAWPHTPPAFLETSSQAGHVFARKRHNKVRHRELRALLFLNTAWVLLRPAGTIGTFSITFMANGEPEEVT